ncbi:FAD-dependent tricarballylate dehydrogenase TcuA [Rhodoblastus sp.]|uniref:FAD-dependent tricarballylate dehydrogenase TcuA n=1 Tax=Rhodoblastus sp. TaxID=1962975 RepID=UPI003F9B35BD
MPATCNVLVIGGGIAGLSAALAARRLGASARLIESAPQGLRGGNARHARNFRIAHDAPAFYAPGAYAADEFLSELIKTTAGRIDADLARALIADTNDTAPWLMANGVRIQNPATGVIPFSRRTAFLLGGGKAMINALYEAAGRIGVAISYDSEAKTLRQNGDGSWQAEIRNGTATQRLRAQTVIAASGGPGGDPDWLRAHFGARADALMIRGGAHSDGRLLQRLIEAGAQEIGDPASGHMVAVDARGPQIDGGIVTRIAAIPYGLVVDRDSGAVELPGAGAGRTHYARWGARIAQCDEGRAFLILDADGLNRAPPTALAPIRAKNLADLAEALGLDAAALARSIAACPKLAGPPFFAFPLRAGLTFVHFGLAVDEKMRVKMRDGGTFANLFAAGMIMAANVLPRGYLAGLGVSLSVGSGRRAGEAAARHALA